MDENKKNYYQARRVRELNVYQKAFDTVMEIFYISEKFPRHEQYFLTDQIRRSSRSVCSSLAEGWRKRRYIAVFLNKLSDCSQEAAETQTWLEFALLTFLHLKTYLWESIRPFPEEKKGLILAFLLHLERKRPVKCRYISQEIFQDLDEKYEHIFAMLANMEKKAESFCR